MPTPDIELIIAQLADEGYEIVLTSWHRGAPVLGCRRKSDGVWMPYANDDLSIESRIEGIRAAMQQTSRLGA